MERLLPANGISRRARDNKCRLIKFAKFGIGLEIKPFRCPHLACGPELHEVQMSGDERKEKKTQCEKERCPIVDTLRCP